MKDSESSKISSPNPFGESGVFRFHETDSCGSTQMRFIGLAKSEWLWSIDYGYAEPEVITLCIKDKKRDMFYPTEKCNFLEHIKKYDPDNLNWVLFNLNCIVNTGDL